MARRAAVYHTRLCRDVLREAGGTVAELDPSDGSWEEGLLHVQATVERIAKIVDEPPRRDAEFFRRRFEEDHAIGKISADTGWSVSTVKRVLKKTQRTIRERVEESLWDSFVFWLFGDKDGTLWTGRPNAHCRNGQTW